MNTIEKRQRTLRDLNSVLNNFDEDHAQAMTEFEEVLSVENYTEVRSIMDALAKEFKSSLTKVRDIVTKESSKS